MENNSSCVQTIGQSRRKTYEILSEYPLYDYFCESKEGKECNVLLIGNGWVGTEFLKAIFWCGIYPGVKLNITIASENATRYQKKLEKSLPGLTTFADIEGESPSKYHYADIRIREVSFEKVKGGGINADMAGESCLNLQAQNYIVVSVGDSTTNYLIAEGIEEFIKKNAKNPRVVLVFTDEEFPEHSLCKAITDSVDDEAWKKLYSLAQNINFMYAMKSAGNSNVDIADVNKEFDEYYSSEFESPIEQGDQFQSIGSFLGGKYAADSSLAAAVSIQYKLHYCNAGKSADRYDCTELIKIINERNEKFSELVQWEHDRWNAFMTIRGFRYPTEQEEQKVLFRGDNDHRQKGTTAPYLHMCLCDSRGRDARQSIDWENPKSELDRVSVKCRNRWKALADRKSDIIKEKISDIRNNLREQKKDGPLPNQTFQLLQNFLDSTEQLLEDKENAFKNYQSDYKVLMPRLDNENSKIKQLVDAIDNAIQPQIKANTKTDFFSIDAELIEMIPNCIRMEEDWTFVAAIEDPAVTDALIPWLTFAKKAIFLYPHNYAEFESLQGQFEDFFQSHGNYIECKWVPTRFTFESLLSTVKRYLQKPCAIGVSSNASPQTALVISRLWDTGVSLVYYDSNKGICTYNAGICQHHLNGKPITINQYLGLKNAFVTKVAKVVPYSDCRELEDLFWRYNTIEATEKPNGDTKYVNRWTQYVPKLFQNQKPKKFDENGMPIQKKFDENERAFLIEFRKKNVLSKVSDCKICPGEKENLFDLLKNKAGDLFEQLVYHKIKTSGLFNDIETGKKIEWDCGVSNELDVIALYGYTPLLISCKTDARLDKEYIYEIASEAHIFNAIPVLAVSQNLFGYNYNHDIVVRAQATGVALIDQHILKDEALTKKALQQIINGTYNGPEDFQ